MVSLYNVNANGDAARNDGQDKTIEGLKTDSTKTREEVIVLKGQCENTKQAIVEIKGDINVIKSEQVKQSNDMTEIKTILQFLKEKAERSP